MQSREDDLAAGDTFLGVLVAGMPRPLSVTESDPSSCRVTAISSQYCAMASSVGVIDHVPAQVIGALGDGVHAGRLRTGSSPVRTSIAEDS